MENPQTFVGIDVSSQQLDVDMLPVSQPFSHYQLPAGMTLIVPASLTPSERKKLTEVLKHISELFSEP